MAKEVEIPRVHREIRDVSGRFIAIAFVGMVASLGISGLVSWWIFPRATQDKIIPDPPPAYPAPQLQPDPHEDWLRFHQAELKKLNSYGWVNKQAGIVHIPINQAMRDIVQRGIPGWPAAGAHP
jgi:hypothetical protein